MEPTGNIRTVAELKRKVYSNAMRSYSIRHCFARMGRRKFMVDNLYFYRRNRPSWRRN